MSKTKVKFIITFVTIVFAIILFNTNTVNATDITDEDVQATLNLIPDEMTLDIMESEYENTETCIKEKLEEIWENNNISTDEITISRIETYTPYAGVDRFHSAIISVNFANKGIQYKEISIVYSNTNSKNTNDEEYIKNIQLESPKYYEVDFNYLLEKVLAEDLTIVDEYLKIREDYYSNFITDTSLDVEYYYGEGGLDLLNFWCSTVVAIFKDNILYDVKNMGQECTIPVITIQSGLSEDEINNYLFNKINEYYQIYGENVISISKSNEYDRLSGISILNGYTISHSGGWNDFIIVKTEETTSINLTSEQTAVKLEADTSVVPSNTILSVAPITSGSTYETIVDVLSDVNQFVAYDITLLSDGVEIQPNGNVKISIPIPEGFDTSKLVIYRIDEDGTKTKYDVTASNGYAVFETNHFSTYVLAEEETTETLRNNETTEELDNTPKTGTETNMYLLVGGLVILVSSVVMIINKRRI